MKIFLPILAILFQANNLSAQIIAQWQKNLGGTSYDNIYSSVNSIDGKLVLAGVTLSDQSGDIGVNHGSADGWILKLNDNGDIIWQKLLGGTGPDFIYCINTTSDHGFILTGKSGSDDGDLSNNNGDYDVWIARLDSAGNIIWSKNYGGIGEDQGAGVIQTPDGGFIIAANSYSSDGDLPDSTSNGDWWIIKISGDGDLDWSKTLGGSGTDAIYDICATRGNGFAIAGTTHSQDGDILTNHGDNDYWVIKFDSLGNIAWQKTLGGENAEEAWNIEQVNDNGFIITGYSGSINSGDVTGGHGFADAWVVKLNESGDLEWQKSIGGTQGDRLLAVTQSDEGGYMLAGNTLSNDGDVTGNTLNDGLWIVQLSSTGKIQYQSVFGGSNTDWANSILKSSDGNYLISGYTRSNDGDISFNHGWLDAYLIQIRDGIVPTFETALTQTVPFYPNPAHQSIAFDYCCSPTELHFSIFNSSGMEVQIGQMMSNEALNVEGWPPGMYLFHARDNAGKTYLGKVLKH